MFDGKPWTAALELEDAVQGAGVAKLWARSKIASLEAKAYGDATFGAIDKAIETVALEHHLVSSQTSLIAIDKTKSRPDGQGVSSVDMPVNLPDGWVYDKVFGPQGHGAARDESRPDGRSPITARVGGSYELDACRAPCRNSPMTAGPMRRRNRRRQPIDAAPPSPDPTQMPDTSMVPTEASPDRGWLAPQATQPCSDT